METLTAKALRALRETGRQALVVAGGVGANRSLREVLRRETEAAGGQVFYPRPALCTDNGAMVAHAGLLRLQAGQISDGSVMARPRWELEQLEAL